MTKDLLLDKDATELQEFVKATGQPVYRARQLLDWLYRKHATAYEDLTNLPKAWREQLQQVAELSPFRSYSVQVSADHARKYLFELHDGQYIESVCIPMKEHFTLCISTQVGCALRCTFCLTGEYGFIRNLTAGEIVGQILAVQRDHVEDLRISNVVLMGMGEPLLNYDNTVKAIRLMLAEEGLNFSNRKITLSTAGVVPGILKLGQEEFTINLAVSLNAPTEELRSQLMPINKTYSLTQLLNACRTYPLPERRRITFEYIMLDRLNDDPLQARTLASLLRGIRCKINLIPLNPNTRTSFRPACEERMLSFQQILIEHGYSVFIRASKGADISAACGQLRGQYLS